jgi:D-alanine-D-alanine ligase
MKINQRIEIVSSCQSGLSSMGRKPREAVQAVLSKHYARVRITIVNDLADLEALVARRPDLVFLGMKMVLTNQSLGIKDPEKIWLGDYLEEHGIAYTGSNHLAHELEVNKDLAKHCVLNAGLKTSPFYVVSKRQHTNLENSPLAYPVFIKPTNRGGGQGIDSQSVAHNFAQLKSKVQSLAINLHADSLVEQYLPGREFSVAILKDEISSELSVMPIEMIAPLDKLGARLLSAEVKEADTESSILVRDENIKSKICNLAINVFHALGARDYGRIDIRLDEFGTPHFLEANLMPSLKRSDSNYFPKACAINLNLGYEETILRITRLGLTRTNVGVKDKQSHPQLFNSFEPALKIS